MKLLTEVMDLNEVNHIRFLFESNGIPVFIGNEDSARNMGLMLPSGKYGVFVLYEEQFHDAKRLLEDGNHIVEHKIDMDEHHRHMELLKPKAEKQIFKAVLIISAIAVIFFMAFVWIVKAIEG